MSPIFKGLKKVILGIGIAGCGAAVLAFAGNEEGSIIAKAATIYDHYGQQNIGVNYYQQFLPLRSFKWDRNWDQRHPTTLLRHFEGEFGNIGYANALNDEAEKEKKLEQAKVTACRNLILIRHGQYELDGKTDAERSLTNLGRQQAFHAAKRLRELNLPFNQIIRSTMTRAHETAEIISKEFPDLPISSCDLLREGYPCTYQDNLNKRNYFRAYRDGPRIEAAFRRYFHRAEPEQKTDSYDIVVCHANVIRYLLCRALQIHPEAWIRFTLHNCSITWITIYPNGRVHAKAVGDAGFMPPYHLTH